MRFPPSQTRAVVWWEPNCPSGREGSSVSKPGHIMLNQTPAHHYTRYHYTDSLSFVTGPVTSLSFNCSLPQAEFPFPSLFYFSFSIKAFAYEFMFTPVLISIIRCVLYHYTQSSYEYSHTSLCWTYVPISLKEIPIHP